MSEWIKVSNRMPIMEIAEGDYLAIDVLATDGVRVALATCAAGNPLTDNGYVAWVAFTDYGEIASDDITHWMPLPEPPANHKPS